MNILVINCGSSSLKFQLIDSASEEVLAKGLCERIGIDGRLVYHRSCQTGARGTGKSKDRRHFIFRLDRSCRSSYRSWWRGIHRIYIDHG